MGSNRNKLLNLLEPLNWTLLAAEASPDINWVGIIGQPLIGQMWDILAGVTHQLITGGATVRSRYTTGCRHYHLSAEQVLIHDGARCLATPDLLDRCAEALLDSPV